MSLRRIDPLLTESNHYNPKCIAIRSGIVVSEVNHGAPSSYETPKKFFRIFVAFKDGIGGPFVDAVYLHENLCLMLSGILSQNIVHSILNHSSFSSLCCCNWNVVKRSGSKRRRCINDHPLLIAPLVSDSSRFFAAFSHRTKTFFPKYKLYCMRF